MTINYKELVLHQGTDFSIELDVVNEYGEPYDLDAYDFFCVARPSYYSERRPLEFNIEKVDKETGTIKMSVEHSNTEHLVNPKLVYTLYSKNIETGIIQSIMEGTIIIYPTTLNKEDWLIG